jgi:SNF2 family DNA or RNA helicase
MTYESKREPRAKQREALDWVRGKTHAALLMARRTGKTKVVIDEWGRAVESKEISDLFVIAPGGVYRTWLGALVDDLDPRIERQAAVFVWDSDHAHTGKGKAAIDAFQAFPGRRILVMNIEALSVKKVGDRLARKAAQQFVTSRCMLVIDESVIVKNRESNASQLVLKTLGPRAGRRLILTGLVAPRNPLDVYAQFRFLDPSIFPESFTKFRERYAVVDYICTLPDKVVRAKYRNALKQWSPEGMSRSEMVRAIISAGRWIQSRPVVKEFKQIDELHARIAPHSFQVSLKDCYDLPPSSYAFRDVEFTPEQKRIYAEMRDLARAEIANEEHVTAHYVITQMLRLHQVCCGSVTGDDGVVRQLPENRTQALLELLEDYDGKAIVWCSYQADLTRVVGALIDEYGPGSVARFWGGNVKTREEEEGMFKTREECRFMVATPDAGGRGRTWDGADLVCYYSQRNNLDHRVQSEDRALNVGKTRSVGFYDLRIPGTVEAKIITALREKMDLASLVEGTDYLKWLV